MRFKDDILVLAGALVGGVLGHLAFLWIARQGFYGLVLPGGLCGLGAGIFRARSKAVPIGCGVLALPLGLFSEWRFAPFVADDSFGYLLTRVHQLQPITLIMIAAGAAIAFWIPFRQLQPAEKPRTGE